MRPSVFESSEVADKLRLDRNDEAGIARYAKLLGWSGKQVATYFCCRHIARYHALALSDVDAPVASIAMKAMRELNDLTQVEMAAKIGIEPETYQLWERDNRKGKTSIVRARAFVAALSKTHVFFIEAKSTNPT